MAYSFNPSIVTNGLVMNFDAASLKSYSGSGTAWTDISGNAIPATLQNSGTVAFSNGYATFTPSDMTSSASYYLINSATISSLTTQLSLECWVYVNTFYANAARPFSPRTTETGSPIGFGINTNGSISYEINTSVNWFTGNTAIVTGAGVWMCISQTTDDANKVLKTYHNGVLLATLAYTGTPNSGGGILLGRGFYAGVNNFNGRIAIARYYNRALSDSEILQNYKAMKGRYGL